MADSFFTRWKLWAIRRLLWRADAIICSLPSPEEPRGDYFATWGDLGSVHRAIDRAYGGPR